MLSAGEPRFTTGIDNLLLLLLLLLTCFLLICSLLNRQL
jgi:hypothetical protein